MRRQRFPYTLSSQDGSSFSPDADSIKVSSGSYTYLESNWPQIISPQPDTLIPYSIYQYPCFQIPSEPVSYIPTFFYPSVTLETSSPFDDLYIYNDDLSSIYNCTTKDFCSNSPCGDGIITEDLFGDIETPTFENFNDIQYENPQMYPTVTPYGTVTILLRHLIRVDISPAKAVYVTNPPAACIAVINGSGNKSCIIHPNGRVHQIGEDIHMVTLDHKAKICRRGIIFTSTKHCLSYLVDNSGTKTASENFRNMNQDFSLGVFYSVGMESNNFEECYKMMSEAVYKSYKNDDEVWKIGGLRIKQDQRGDVKITRNGDCCAIQTSPTTGQVSVKTFSADINVGRYHNKYFDVRKGDKHVTASLTEGLKVRNKTQKAGFNRSGKVVLF